MTLRPISFPVAAASAIDRLESPSTPRQFTDFYPSAVGVPA
jgi:hypothetical protein